MAGATSGERPPLSSDWGGMNPNLIARFFPVKRVVSEDKKSVRWERMPDSPEVRAPLTDGRVDTTLTWQSPFEGSGVDQKFSSLSAMLQSGGFTALLQELQQLVPNAQSVREAASAIEGLEGRSNLTRLNSTQVFVGMPPVQIGVTAHFRAFSNAKAEVRDPINQLMAWALPQELAQDGPVMSAAKGDPALFPSKTPQIIGMQYADMLFWPLVIEGIPYELTGPRDRNGVLTQAAVQLQLASLTALDKTDWANSNNPNFWRTSAKF